MQTNYDDNALILTREKAGGPVLKIDKTFATRFSALINYVVNNYGAGDFMIDQEGWYIKSVADNMLQLQKESISSMEEEQYFKNLDNWKKK